MTITVTGPAALLHTSGARFKALAGSVLPFVAEREDATSPAPVTHLHIEAVNNELLLIGTDRKSLAIVRQSLTATSAKFAVRVSVPADTIGARLDTIDDKTRVSLAIEPRKITLAYGRTEVHIPARPSELPWRSAITDHLTDDDVLTDRLMIDPFHLAKLGPAKALAKPRKPMNIHLRGTNGPIIATEGRAFLALIMPRAIPGHPGETLPEQPLGPWLDLINE
ncbi:hypothetical protein [Nonomuraea basaltis]|uniref:hypothetical protein n=1 Tax=Nonomuraea basaltis TaxID=2495887 RepID=UPI00110C62CF|nr:hypothetical protein [Nonomuraea basaltis]TMR88148.1 hypothetical protein EJK15_67870 [Nonomuraea basaltis]